MNAKFYHLNDSSGKVYRETTFEVCENSTCQELESAVSRAIGQHVEIGDGDGENLYFFAADSDCADCIGFVIQNEI